MEKYLKNFQCLNQNNYGEDNDCSLTSIAACIYYLNKNKYSIKDIYLTVEKIASKYGYTGTKGTSPFKIAKIFEESYFELFNDKIQNRGIYLKGLGYNFNTIKNQIDLNKPVILSLWSSPKYKNHTITVIGYKDNNTLIINDNWSIKQTEIIYKDISLISSINIIV